MITYVTNAQNWSMRKPTTTNDDHVRKMILSERQVGSDRNRCRIRPGGGNVREYKRKRAQRAERETTGGLVTNPRTTRKTQLTPLLHQPQHWESAWHLRLRHFLDADLSSTQRPQSPWPHTLPPRHGPCLSDHRGGGVPRATRDQWLVLLQESYP